VWRFFAKPEGLTLTVREEPVNTFARRTKMTVNETKQKERSGMIMQKRNNGKN